MKYEICILGAGPAGLTCAYEHAKQKRTGLILDKNPIVGGLARTEIYKGYRFDVGPHRFFTKNDEIDRLWHEIGGDEIIRVPRMTRIIYKGKFFEYPLKPFQALFGLGIFTSMQAFFSYIAAHLFHRKKEIHSFEDWVVHEFGRKLYTIFFKTYTEKVWGIPCSQIGAEWAAQRIKGLSLKEIIRNSFVGQRQGKKRVKSLVDEFSYPKHGAGRVYEKMRDYVVANGFEMHNSETVEKIQLQDNHEYIIQTRLNDGTTNSYSCKAIFSSIPLTEFILKFRPHAPGDVLESARSLYYRDHITLDFAQFCIANSLT